MYKREREQQILNLLQEKHQISVSELSSLLFTSESSIRRALTGLEGKGLVRRTYGGAELLEHHTNLLPVNIDIHLHICQVLALEHNGTAGGIFQAVDTS